MTMAGYAAGLATCPSIEVVAALGHNEALSDEQDWAGADVVLIDAADARLPEDQFPGVKVVKRVRACQGDRRPVVIVVTGHFFNDGLRHRMAEAEADFFFEREDLRTPEALVDVVLHPEHYRRGVPAVADPDLRRGLGITDKSRVEELVEYVEAHGLASALDPAQPERENPRSRRWFRHRQAMAEAARIEPVNLTTGDTPYRGQRVPSMRQLCRDYAWAAKITRWPPR